MAIFEEKVTLKKLWEVLKASGKRWNDADPFRQAAIISFYAILSLPALLVIIISIAGYFFGEDAVSGNLSNEISEMIGSDAAVMVEELVANASQAESGTIGIIIGVGVIIFGATTVFFQLQKSLNRIWGVMPKPGGAMKKYLVDRLFSFGLILVIGFLLLISLVLSSMMAILSDWLQTYLPSYLFILINIVNYLISLGVIATLFAMMFKMLPDAKIEWKSVWVGGFLTALLFEIGKFGLSIYFGTAEPESVYGAAGSIVLILIWISYVSMILFYGAEFTRTWAVKFGHGIKPKDNAILISEHYDNPYLME
ncbi:YihY/virulence factor BrkB family protein [Anditalea andensis]|uniref:Ribonuclease BN n=1 Tax=Anditalea andensis TaxID=1048983 RepID=A0A074LNM9_9BACT|nr:YihY/virulence factor BrkB family protein [Anditalea andensis]KEO75522.1 ribonuclease BN [Anditalea andensis]